MKTRAEILRAAQQAATEIEQLVARIEKAQSDLYAHADEQPARDRHPILAGGQQAIIERLAIEQLRSIVSKLQNALPAKDQ